ncbi:60S ribosomal protein L7a [Galemys pyrenaicus]|uniref:60S ribosomal protein L7a n=1 Tax=Galemys pyrenaicus TaxID=202257 RepID=A0A8J6AB37_GALPY|nr:60S ribosomal protein L7a [Galemys pyrenaicus]
MLKRKAKGKKVTPGPTMVKKQEANGVVNALFEKRPKNFGISQSMQPQRDLTCFVKWPLFIRPRWLRAVLYKLLSVPSAMNQLTQALDCQTASYSAAWAGPQMQTRDQAREVAETVGPG